MHRPVRGYAPARMRNGGMIFLPQSELSTTSVSLANTQYSRRAHPGFPELTEIVHTSDLDWVFQIET